MSLCKTCHDKEHTNNEPKVKVIKKIIRKKQVGK